MLRGCQIQPPEEKKNCSRQSPVQLYFQRKYFPIQESKFTRQIREMSNGKSVKLDRYPGREGKVIGILINIQLFLFKSEAFL